MGFCSGHDCGGYKFKINWNHMSKSKTIMTIYEYFGCLKEKKNESFFVLNFKLINNK